MSFSKGTTRAARQAYLRYRNRVGVYSNLARIRFSKGITGHRTLGPVPQIILDRQLLAKRTKKLKITLPLIKEP